MYEQSDTAATTSDDSKAQHMYYEGPTPRNYDQRYTISIGREAEELESISAETTVPNLKPILFTIPHQMATRDIIQ